MLYCDQTHTAGREQDQNRTERLRRFFVIQSQSITFIQAVLIPWWQLERNNKLFDFLYVTMHVFVCPGV